MVKPSGQAPLHCVFGHEVTRAFHKLHGRIVCGDCIEDMLTLIGINPSDHTPLPPRSDVHR